MSTSVASAPARTTPGDVGAVALGSHFSVQEIADRIMMHPPYGESGASRTNELLSVAGCAGWSSAPVAPFPSPTSSEAAPRSNHGTSPTQ